MNKKIIAVIVALVIMILTFAACKKDKNDEIYFVDDEGKTQQVEVDDEGKYFITDEKGNVSYVEDESVIEQIEQQSESAKLEDLMEEIGSNPDKLFENANKDDGLQMSGDLVDEQIVTVAPDKGKANADARLKSFKKILDTNKFTIQATIKEVGVESMEYPFVYIRSGNGAYIETAVPFDESGKIIKANMIIIGDVSYCEIPSLKSYMIVDDMGMDDLASGTFDGNEIETYVFVESGSVAVNGKKYTCDVYQIGNETAKYYYDSNNTLVRIERISKRESVITEIKSVKNTADASKIKKPKGINLTPLLG